MILSVPLETESWRDRIIGQLQPCGRSSAFQQVLRKLGLKPGQLELLPATRQVKVRLARRLRRETTMSLKWIAEQLGIGSWKYLSNLLSQRRTNTAQAELGL